MNNQRRVRPSKGETRAWVPVRAAGADRGAGVSSTTAFEETLADLVDEALKKSLDHAAEGLHWVAADGTILWANQTELDLLGYARDEYIGHHISEFHVDRPVIEDILARLQRGETLLSYDARLRHKNGSTRDVQINSNVLWRNGQFQHTRCFTRDVTDRKTAEALARRLADIVEHSTDAMISQDLREAITLWNPAAERLYGYTAVEAVGQSIQLIIPADRRHEHEDVLRRVRAGERVEAFETIRRRKDGSYADISLTVSPIKDRLGAVVGASKLARDISDRKRTEARDRFLVQLDDAVRLLTDAEEITVAAASTLGRYLGVHRCAYATVDSDEDAFLLRGNYTNGVPSIVGRYTFRQFGEECLRLMRAGEPYVVNDSEVDPRMTPSEQPSYAATAIRAVICVPVLKAGRFVAAMAVHAKTARAWQPGEVKLVQQVASRCWESIERARVTRELGESGRQFRDLANSIPNLAWMARPDGWIYWFNDQWYAYTGTTQAEMEGWGWQSVHDPSVLAAVSERWRESIDTGTPFEMVFPLRGAGGEFRRFLTRVNPVRDAQGHVVHWFGTNTDVEDERCAAELNAVLRAREHRAREEADRLREQAEAANQAKDEFLAMLGHELRNPLSPMLTALQLIKLRGGDESERERAVIERQVNHLTRLVDDLLDVSRIARGKVELKEEIVEVAEVAAKAIEIASPLLEQRAHKMTVKVPRRNLAVRGDATRLSQVISNLLTNAAKYTGVGGQIMVHAEADGPDVVIRVRDTGIGIAPELLPRVFDLFVQERQAIDRAQGGLGLGLSIARSLVERHGGSISAHSDGPGHGSEFIVRLPKASSPSVSRVESPERPAPIPVNNAWPGALRILVVEDHEDSADMLAEALQAHGYQTQVARDASSALRLAEDFAPHVAFLDIGLPVMDGYQLAARLRTMPGLGGIRLIALTGYGQESDRERTRAAGFHHHLVKPVDLSVLESVVISAESPRC